MHTEPTRLTEFCGFLGSGKTTFLRHQLQTSGLADPGPIVAAIEAVPEFAGRLIVTEVVTFVDAVYGGETLRQEPLARAQVAGAKALVLTKLDQCPRQWWRHLRRVCSC